MKENDQRCDMPDEIQEEELWMWDDQSSIVKTTNFWTRILTVSKSDEFTNIPKLCVGVKGRRVSGTRMVGRTPLKWHSPGVINDLYPQQPTVLNLPKVVLQQPSSRSNENLSLICLYMQQKIYGTTPKKGVSIYLFGIWLFSVCHLLLTEKSSLSHSFNMILINLYGWFN